MKKFIVVLVLLFAVSTVTVFAQSIQLGNFPVGRWVDPNPGYDAVWDFSSSNIRILNSNGAVLYDFSTVTINDFRVFVDGINPGISFSCPQAGRSYRFTIQFTGNLRMEITRPDEPVYDVSMPKQ